MFSPSALITANVSLHRTAWPFATKRVRSEPSPAAETLYRPPSGHSTPAIEVPFDIGAPTETSITVLKSYDLIQT